LTLPGHHAKTVGDSPQIAGYLGGDDELTRRWWLAEAYADQNEADGQVFKTAKYGGRFAIPASSSATGPSASRTDGT
jgi:hypothetical protein